MSGGEISRGLYDISNIISYGIFGAKFDTQKNEVLIKTALKSRIRRFHIEITRDFPNKI